MRRGDAVGCELQPQIEASAITVMWRRMLLIGTRAAQLGAASDYNHNLCLLLLVVSTFSWPFTWS